MSSILTAAMAPQCGAASSGTSLEAQAAISIWVVLFVVAKMWYQPGGRTWAQRGVDASKLVIGDLALHGLNLLLIRIAAAFKGDTEDDACEVYFAQVLVNTTIGVLAADRIYGWLFWIIKEYMGVRRAKFLVRRVSLETTDPNREPLLEPVDGDIMDSRSIAMMWAQQVVFWVVVVALAKIAMVVSSPFSVCAEVLWHHLVENRNEGFKTWVAMFLVPFIFDPIQYMLFDQVLLTQGQRFNDERQLKKLIVKNKDLDKCLEVANEQFQAWCSQSSRREEETKQLEDHMMKERAEMKQEILRLQNFLMDEAELY